MNQQATLQAMNGYESSFLLLVAMPFVTSSFLLLIVWPGVPSSVHAPSSKSPAVSLEGLMIDLAAAHKWLLG